MQQRFRYFALELCAATLHQYCMRRYNGPMPPVAVVLLHIVRGLRHVHCKGFAHRNIEPKNILISKSFPTRIILSDFGLSKSVSNLSGSYSVSQDRSINQDGQLLWLAPELLDNPDDQGFSEKRGSIASDTFSAGCVFFFYLTPGWHPFGSGLDSIYMNILNGKPVILRYLPEEQHRFKSTIEAMILKKPEDRISLEQVENNLQEIIGPYLFEAETESIRIPDDGEDGQDERPDWLM
ncbi:serine/threonine-protein kinase/endoribonuclease IRE2 isoform X2 [Daphnia magna]|uniref:serine/threonine-protein kinase/endoribonuclease IRE2 isoform X2 n=1 Tax=Daphnia magna TaxID=35525 RepID=UPI001E1BDE39|nr:serine/threonine-protein kinase/endoribonuclease IRE2 isoform X2 [Daphnia magna]